MFLHWSIFLIRKAVTILITGKWKKKGKILLTTTLGGLLCSAGLADKARPKLRQNNLEQVIAETTNYCEYVYSK